MKKRAIIVLCLALVLTLIGCGNNAQSSDEHKCEDGFFFIFTNLENPATNVLVAALSK